MKFKNITYRLIKFCRSKQAVSTFWAFLGLAGPTFLQVVYIVVAARILGADIAGNLFLIVSVALIGSSFVGLGGGGLVMRDTARDASKASIAFGRVQAMSYVTFPILLPFVVAGAWYVTKGQVPIWVILAVSASDLLASRMVTTSWSLFIALEEQVRASVLICTMPLARLLAVTSIALWPESQQFAAFSMLYFIASFSVLVCVLFYVRSRIGKSRLSLSGFEHVYGISFSTTWLNTALQTESDKLLLGIFSTPATVAIYAVASRLMDGAIMPARAIRISILSRLFREGAAGHLSAYNFTMKILPISIVYGLCAWIGFWLLSPIIARIFGPEFSDLVLILPLLGAVPLLRAISDHGAEVFTTSDRPNIQALTQTFATLTRVGLGIFLISAYGLYGAVATALVVSALSAVIFWGLAWKLSRH